MQAYNQDLESDGHISEAFDHLEQSMELEFCHTRKSIDRLRHELSEVKGGIDAILQRLTKVDDF